MQIIDAVLRLRDQFTNTIELSVLYFHRIVIVERGI